MLSLKTSVSLLPYNTFRIDAKAKYFVEITSEEVLKELFDSPIFKQEKKQILGGGAKVFFTEDFEGLVIKMEIKGITTLQNSLYPSLHKKGAKENITVRVGAWEDWSEFVTYANEHQRAGIENLIAIPGNVGTAPFSNIWAYGMEVGNNVARVEGYDLTTGEKKIYPHQDCKFGYRSSIFKTTLRNQFLITAVVFSLVKFDDNYTFITHYPDVQERLKGKKVESLTEISDIIADIRANKLPDIKKIWTVGSFFVNPIVCKQHFEALQKVYPEIPWYPVDDKEGALDKAIVKIPAGWLIEQAGLKGYSNGKAGTSPQHALIIINEGGNAKDILKVVEHIQQTVTTKFGIDLQPEVVYV